MLYFYKETWSPQNGSSRVPRACRVLRELPFAEISHTVKVAFSEW